MHVSVVVPVYNGEALLEQCLASFKAQTMAASEREIVFVDDGSTDGSGALLDAFAAADPAVRVIHQENSGWPGKPRNVGVRAATGEYVQFVDQDDRLEPDALEALYAIGKANASDIVIGKVASNFRGVPTALFARTRPDCNVHSVRLMSSLTPHKMFRRAFLVEHGIEFPEGRRRLEDQLFMARAYFAARHVAVLADRVCYRYLERPDKANAGAERINPAGYYGNLDEVIEVVLAHTEPGPFRNGILHRFYQVEILGRLSEPGFLEHDAAYRQELVDVVRELTTRVMNDEVVASLGTVGGLRAGLIQAGRAEDLAELARRLSEVGARTTAMASAKAGRLVLDVEAQFLRDGSPLALAGTHKAPALDTALTDGITGALLPLREPVADWSISCSLVDPVQGDEWLPGSRQARTVVHEPVVPGPSPVLQRKFKLDLGRVAGGRPLPFGTWHVRARVKGPGIERRMEVVASADIRLESAIDTPEGPRHLSARATRGGPIELTVSEGGHRDRWAVYWIRGLRKVAGRSSQGPSGNAGGSAGTAQADDTTA